MTRPIRATSTFVIEPIALNPILGIDSAVGSGIEEEDPIYVSLTKEVAVRHNGKTDRAFTKNTACNVLQ
jgi:hypothetical protein